jgi:hypothetical protein
LDRRNLFNQIELAGDLLAQLREWTRSEHARRPARSAVEFVVMMQPGTSLVSSSDGRGRFRSRAPRRARRRAPRSPFRSSEALALTARPMQP